jgi:hypothetical protein
MTEAPFTPEMEKSLEAALRLLAAQRPYPPTPDISGVVMHRLGLQRAALPGRRQPFAWKPVAQGILLFLVLLAGLLLVPGVRAALTDFLQIGVVRIFLTAPTPSAAVSTTTAQPSASPAPTETAIPTPLPSLLDIEGETTLEDARQRLDFEIPLPTYPADLGLPDHVFVQKQNTDMLILAWVDREDPKKVELSLHIYGENTYQVEKWDPYVVEATKVGDNPALWTVGPYPLIQKDGDFTMQRLIYGHVLVWEEGDITYRLETDVELEEALKIAESLAF